MPRRRFWPSDNVRSAANSAIQRRGLKRTPDVLKAMRYHYQKLADKGEFDSYTSQELALMGVDVTTWNEGKGYLPADFLQKETLFLQGKLTPQTVKDSPPVRGPEPAKRGGTTAIKNETIDRIQGTGKSFKEEKEDDSLPVFNGRKWKGEHREWGKKGEEWILKEGMRWNPILEIWEPGRPILDEFHWQCEFMNDPRKFHDPVKYGAFHREILRNMQRYMRICILVGRDHLKTTVFNVNHICYYALEKPELAKMGILNIAWSPILASTTFNKVLEHLEENEKILDFYGCVIDQNRSKTKEYAYFTYQGTGADYGIRCTSFKSGSIVGAHPILVLIDDVADKPLTEKLMENFKQVMDKTLAGAMGKHGRIIMTGTIKGWTTKNDPYIYIETKRSWKVFKYPSLNKVPEWSDIKWEWRERPARDHATGEIIYDWDGVTPLFEEYIHVEIKDAHLYQTIYPERYGPEDIIRKRIEMFDEDDKIDDDWWSEFMLEAMDPAGRYFNRKRIAHMPPPGFVSARAFREYLKKKHCKVYLWIDPGGEKGHGIAVVVGAKYKGRYYFFEFAALGLPPAKAAEVIGRIMVDWEVDAWGVEGNYQQKETFGNIMGGFIKDYLYSEGLGDYYHTPKIKNSVGDKFQRINTHISGMIGTEGQDTTIYVNSASEHFPTFDKQVTSFGLNMASSKKHEFDILDDMAQMKIHCFSRGSGAAMAAA